ncbi:YmaF family protein [Gorillibacterium massiliense]|uniref:YmaF family protein n=1 Tax=Gorillibacterium massiliense TaxID=1280390 RepID=UPI0009DE3C50|nr:YmaF family protein [Gorillibacterium massiliense]
MKKVPVQGYLYHAEGSENEHAHGLYITSWDGRPVHHVHPFSGDTSFDDGHCHQYAGVTEPAPTGVPHVHRYCTITTVNHGHTHVIEGVTGPAIDVPDGGHIHCFEGFTTVNGMRPHAHCYKGITGNEA